MFFSLIKKSYIYFLLFAVLFTSCTSKEEKQRQKERAIENAKNQAVADFVSVLPESVKISQLFLVNIEGSKDFIPVEKTGILYGNKNQGEPLVPGGCLFFSYNVAKSKEEVKHFTASINSFYINHSNIPPFMAIDQEGGYVNRLRSITDSFPSNKQVADNYSIEQAAALYSTQATQMSELGFNMNLAPVVEVESEENSSFLDTRSFGSLEKILQFAPLEVTAFENKNVLTVLKHFPGNTNTDPHTGLPEIKVTKQKLQTELLEPFNKILPYSSAVLMSHARVFVEDAAEDKNLNVDSKIPSCFSDYWIKEVLRKQYGFKGLILSDDIFMGALADHGFSPEVAALKAVEAGIDIIMLSEKRFGSTAQILLNKAHSSPEFAEIIEESVRRVIKYKIKCGILELKQIDFDQKGKKLEIPSFKVELSSALKGL